MAKEGTEDNAMTEQSDELPSRDIVPRVVQLCVRACEKVSEIGPIGVTDENFTDGWNAACRWCVEAVRMMDPQ